MQKMHGLLSGFSQNFSDFAAFSGVQRVGDSRWVRGAEAFYPFTLAPPKRSFQRGMTSRL
jgi:hypothetical protein